jgi:hypothetical protein
MANPVPKSVPIPNNATLIDVAKALDPDGNIASVAELLSQSNEILTDAVFKEGNLPTGDRISIRTGLPAVYWRALNQGIPTSKSTKATVEEACGILEANSEIDADLVSLNGNTAAYRLSEDVAFLEAMNQEQANTLFYGDPKKNPKEYLGLAPRYSDMKAGNKQNILSCGGTSAKKQTSIYLVGWGDRTIYCPFPKGSVAGLQQEDGGKQRVYTDQNKTMMAYVTHYQWKNGLAVRDWRYVVRIANIEVDDLEDAKGTQASTATTALIRKMAQALYRLPSMGVSRPAFYMNRTTHSGLASQALTFSQNVLKIHDGITQYGTPHSWLSFLGIPLRIADSISLEENLVK